MKIIVRCFTVKAKKYIFESISINFKTKYVCLLRI